ncbi:MAG: STAS domain-containing protein [Candidatus Omnitrophota bacterium]
MDLKVRVEELQQGYILIELVGDMDAYTSKGFKKEVEALIKRRKYKLIVDVEKVSCIDSVGVGILLGALKKTREKKGDLWLIYNKSKVKRFLELTGLNKNFKVFKNRQQTYKKLK